MAIVLRNTKGSPLTIEELDGNFEYLNEQVKLLDGKITKSVNIASIERNGNALWFISKTGDVIADITLPETTISAISIPKLPVYDHKTINQEAEIGQLSVFLNKSGKASVIFYDGAKWCHVNNNEPIK